MNLDQDFFQGSKLSEDQKKKVFTRNRTLFSPNSGEDQKKGLHQKWNTFFPEFKYRPALRFTPESNYWRDADEDHTQIVGGDTVKLLGGIYPPLPRVSAPLRLLIMLLHHDCTKGTLRSNSGLFVVTINKIVFYF